MLEIIDQDTQDRIHDAIQELPHNVLSIKNAWYQNREILSIL